jgi:hypothetical protein
MTKISLHPLQVKLSYAIYRFCCYFQLSMKSSISMKTRRDTIVLGETITKLVSLLVLHVNHLRTTNKHRKIKRQMTSIGDHGML